MYQNKQQLKNQFTTLLNKINVELFLIDKIELFKTASIYLQNVVHCPQGLALQRSNKIKEGNKKFQSIIRLESGRELMKICGFVPMELDEGEGVKGKYYVVEGSLSNKVLPEAQVSYLNTCLKVMRHHVEIWNNEYLETTAYKPNKISADEAVLQVQYTNLERDWKACLEGIVNVLSKIDLQPGVDQWRTLGVIKPTFASQIGMFEGSYTLLKALGFLHTHDGTLILPKKMLNTVKSSINLINNTVSTYNPTKNHWRSGKIPRTERFMATMVLSSVGDSFGYNYGAWENCRDGSKILSEIESVGGLNNLSVGKFIASDDTIMHMATAESLLTGDFTPKSLHLTLAKSYKECLKVVDNRNFDPFTLESLKNLDPTKAKAAPFNNAAKQSSASTRAMCIGLYYCKPENIDSLIRVSIESARITHHHPVGYLGSYVSALFTNFAIQAYPVVEWGLRMLGTLARVKEYIVDSKVEQNNNLESFDQFQKLWQKYLVARNIHVAPFSLKYPTNWSIQHWDKFYKEIGMGSIPGACGHDATIIAYEAILGADFYFKKQLRASEFSKDGSRAWTELVIRSICHGGDSDNTGSIACAWYGAKWGFRGIPLTNLQQLEFYSRLSNLGNALSSATD